MANWKERESFSLLLDAFPLAVVELDRDGLVQLWNPAAERLFGWRESEVMGKPSPLKATSGRESQALSDNGLMGVESKRHNKKGDLVDVGIFSNTLRDGQGSVVGTIHIFEGIEVRKKLERERIHLAAIVQSANNAIYSWDLNTLILSWNLGAEQVYGYTAAEAIGKPMALIVPPDMEMQYRSFVSMVQQGMNIESFQTERIRKDGRRIWVSLTLSPVRMPSGDIVAASAIAHDITKWKFFQEALADSKTLRGVISICAACKKVQDERGLWGQIESYISQHTEAEFSHGICPECRHRLYPESSNGVSDKAD